jgi:hypothetical protein
VFLPIILNPWLKSSMLHGGIDGRRQIASLNRQASHLAPLVSLFSGLINIDSNPRSFARQAILRSRFFGGETEEDHEAGYRRLVRRCRRIGIVLAVHHPVTRMVIARTRTTENKPARMMAVINVQ